MSEKNVIRHESDLVHEFRQLVAIERDIHWCVEAGSLLEVSLDGRKHRFKPVYFLKPNLADLKSLVSASDRSSPLPILIATELSSHILDFCRQHQLSAFDLNGRIYLRAKGLLVDRNALPGRKFRFEVGPRNVFVGKSARIIRALLTDRDRVWRQSELVPRTKASPGLVSRIVNHLQDQGFVAKKSTREFLLREPLALLDAWAESDNFSRRTTTVRYTVFGGSPLDLAAGLVKLAAENAFTIAFTQWLAVWLRHPYTEPVIVSAYVSRLPADHELAGLGLRQVNEAGKVWFHLPDDEGVFLEIQPVNGLPLASDAQLYLDLLKTGLRGPDQAAALRDWEGFCRHAS